MYKVEFPIWYGFSSKKYHLAGNFETFEEAKLEAIRVYGRVTHDSKIVFSNERE